MIGRAIQFEPFQVSQRARRDETGDIRHVGMRTNVEKDTFGREPPCASVAGLDLQRVGAGEVSLTHDQFGAALLVVRQVNFDEAIHHVALATADALHADRERLARDAEFSGPTKQRSTLALWMTFL